MNYKSVLFDREMIGSTSTSSLSSCSLEESPQSYSDIVRELDYYYGLVKRQLLRYQSSTCGLYPDQSDELVVGSVRDSIYSATAVWSLYQAYRRIDDDRGKSYELGQSCVACMRGILGCWMRQADKLEAWKTQQEPKMALHVVFHLDTGQEIVSANQYHHLQLDVVSLYLIFLVQMTTSGLEIIYTMDEVSLVQNLVYYVERAYRIPDYGVWGRGTKYNNGQMESHASSIGMAQAALESINGFNLFGDRGCNYSVIYADIDAHNRNITILKTLLPRESNTKNVDAALLSVISFPGFAIHDEKLYEKTKAKIVGDLEGRYGFKRFLYDGFETSVEDPTRKYYKKGEIMEFEDIENEWPIFYLYMIVEGVFKDNVQQVEKYQELISKRIVYGMNGDPIVPKYFKVCKNSVKQEKTKPGSQKRFCSSNSIPEVSLWAQSMLIIAELLTKNLLHKTELDPIRRHLCSSSRPIAETRYSTFNSWHFTTTDLVVQVALISESTRLQAMLANYGIQTQTPTEVEPVQIWSPKQLVSAFRRMGCSKRLGLKGRPERPIGALGTSKVYRVSARTILCYPLVLSGSDFYLSHDMALLTSDIRSELQFIGKNWRLAGRPTVCLVISEDNMRDPQFPKMMELLAELKQGQCGGVKIRLGRLQNLISSSCIEHLDFMGQGTLNKELDIHPLEELACQYAGYQSLTDIPRIMEINEKPQNYAAQYKFKSTEEIKEALHNMDNMYGCIQLFGILLDREGGEYMINDSLTVTERLEQYNAEAGRLRYWAAVRYASSLLKKMVNSICPYVTQIIVSGKNVTVGTAGVDFTIFEKPMAPAEIHTAIYSKVQPYDVIGAVLQQEMILYCGQMIAIQPELFSGILVLRMSWVVQALGLYEEFKHPDMGDIENISPSEVKQLLYNVLNETRDVPNTKTNLTKQQIRQLNGCLMRVPENFYTKVWIVLSRCPGGIRFQNMHLPQQPTISTMPKNEMDFAILVEGNFVQFKQPEHKQIIVELLCVLATILERNPEINFKQEINVDALIKEAYVVFSKETENTKTDDMKKFYELVPAMTTSYLARTIVNTLLVGMDYSDGESSNCALQ